MAAASALIMQRFSGAMSSSCSVLNQQHTRQLLMRTLPAAWGYSTNLDQQEGPDTINNPYDDEHRAYNFSPGPGTLSTSVMRRAQQEFCNYKGTGMGILEMTNLDRDSGKHPGEGRVPVQTMMLETEAKLRQVLEIPDNYRVLFMHGGAVAQFSAVPLNLLGGSGVGCDIVDVGYWSQRATAEASKYCDVHVPAATDVRDKGRIPHVSSWDVRPGTAYVHIAINETVEGVEFVTDPLWTHEAPLVADATSVLLSRPMDVSQYGMIYASGGKNIPASMAVVIIREDLLEREPHPHCPKVLQYSANGGALSPTASVFESAPNTPPVFATYLLGLVLDEILEEGGLGAVERRMAKRAERLYKLIDSSGGFYFNPNDNSCRSRMNAVFRIKGGNRSMEQKFVTEAEQVRTHIVVMCLMMCCRQCLSLACWYASFVLILDAVVPSLLVPAFHALGSGQWGFSDHLPLRDVAVVDDDDDDDEEEDDDDEEEEDDDDGDNGDDEDNEEEEKEEEDDDDMMMMVMVMVMD